MIKVLYRDSVNHEQFVGMDGLGFNGVAFICPDFQFRLPIEWKGKDDLAMIGWLAHQAIKSAPGSIEMKQAARIYNAAEMARSLRSLKAN